MLEVALPVTLKKQLGLPNNFGNTGFPLIGSGNLAANNGGYSGTQYIYGLSQIIWNADENLTKTLGRHKLEFGGRYRLERFNDLPDQYLLTQLISTARERA